MRGVRLTKRAPDAKSGRLLWPLASGGRGRRREAAELMFRMALRRNAFAARRTPGSVLAIFGTGIDNTIGFIGRSAVTLKIRLRFSKAQRTKSGSGRHG